MSKKNTDKEDENSLADNEEFISRDDIGIEVISTEDEDDPAVYVKFTGFDDVEDAEEYANFLANTLPLLLFETTRYQ